MDWKFDIPATEDVEVDAETAAAIEQGISDANEGRTVRLDEARLLVSEWISKFASQKPR